MLKILFISPYFPYYNKGGGGTISLQRIKSLSKFAEIDLIFLTNGEEFLKYKDEFKNFVKEFNYVKQNKFEIIKNILFYFQKKSLRECFAFSKNLLKILKEKILLNKYDFVWFNHERTFQYSFYIPYCKKIVDLHDVTSERHKKTFLKEKNPFLKLIHLYEFFRIKNVERKILKNADGIIVTSKEERKKLKNNKKVFELAFYPEIRIRKMENDEKNILFIGDMDYFPNKDALFYFIKKIFPHIKQKIKDAKLFIVGPSMNKSIKKLSNGKDIFTKGFVPKIEEVYSKTNVLVVPLRIGTGIRVKIIEAMANGVPIVSTKIGCEGIKGIKDGVNIMIRDNPLEFAEAVERLLVDKKLAASISKEGYNLVKKYYSEENLKEIIKKIFENKK
jgi:glycosyltransferase involved in cell wall biosynthesis